MRGGCSPPILVLLAMASLSSVGSFSLSSVGSFLGGVVTPMQLPSLVTEPVRAMARMGMRKM